MSKISFLGSNVSNLTIGKKGSFLNTAKPMVPLAETVTAGSSIFALSVNP